MLEQNLNSLWWSICTADDSRYLIFRNSWQMSRASPAKHHFSLMFTLCDTDFEKVLTWILGEQQGSVNFYMFHGGTNFGFMNGGNEGLNATNEGDIIPYQPAITSYGMYPTNPPLPAMVCPLPTHHYQLWCVPYQPTITSYGMYPTNPPLPAMVCTLPTYNHQLWYLFNFVNYGMSPTNPTSPAMVCLLPTQHN